MCRLAHDDDKDARPSAPSPSHTDIPSGWEHGLTIKLIEKSTTPRYWIEALGGAAILPGWNVAVVEVRQDTFRLWCTLFRSLALYCPTATTRHVSKPASRWMITANNSLTLQYSARMCLGIGDPKGDGKVSNRPTPEHQDRRTRHCPAYQDSSRCQVTRYRDIQCHFSKLVYHTSVSCMYVVMLLLLFSFLFI